VSKTKTKLVELEVVGFARVTVTGLCVAQVPADATEDEIVAAAPALLEDAEGLELTDADDVPIGGPYEDVRVDDIEPAEEGDHADLTFVRGPDGKLTAPDTN
jgi:hypothetical protein